MPAFLKYDQTISARFVVARHEAEDLVQPELAADQLSGGRRGEDRLDQRRGRRLHVGMATRHGITLIVTLLHCPALTEIKSAETLLNWGSSAGGRVAAIGTVGQPGAACSAPPTAAASPRPRPRELAVARPRPAAACPSVLAAAGFSGAAVAAAIGGFAYSRRQRLRSASSSRYRGPLPRPGPRRLFVVTVRDCATGPDERAVTASPVLPSHPKRASRNYHGSRIDSAADQPAHVAGARR